MTSVWLGVLSVPALPLGIAAYNLLTWPRPRPRVESETATISVLVPARNEERSLPAALDSILRESSVTEVLVCDDGSTDRTSEIVRGYASRDPRVRLLSGASLPAGWVGKPHACHQLARAATSEILCFLDADVRLNAGAVNALARRVGRPEERRAVTAVPRQEMASAGEKLVLPLLVLTYLCWLPLTLVGRGRDPRFVAACGQILCLRRETYDWLGGFESVRNAIVDDVAFCRRAKERGAEVDFIDGSSLAVCRMYASFGEVWRGFSKNIFEGLGRSVSALAVAVALHLLSFVVPFVALVACLLGYDGIPLAPAALGVAANLALRATLVRTHGHPPFFAFTHPLGVIVLVAIALNSARWTLRGGIEWAGRTYGGGEGTA